MNKLIKLFAAAGCAFGLNWLGHADVVEPLTSSLMDVHGDVTVVTNQIEWIESITNNLPKGESTEPDEFSLTKNDLGKLATVYGGGRYRTIYWDATLASAVTGTYVDLPFGSGTVPIMYWPNASMAVTKESWTDGTTVAFNMTVNGDDYVITQQISRVIVPGFESFELYGISIAGSVGDLYIVWLEYSTMDGLILYNNNTVSSTDSYVINEIKKKTISDNVTKLDSQYIGYDERMFETTNNTIVSKVPYGNWNETRDARLAIETGVVRYQDAEHFKIQTLDTTNISKMVGREITVNGLLDTWAHAKNFYGDLYESETTPGDYYADLNPDEGEDAYFTKIEFLASDPDNAIITVDSTICPISAGLPCSVTCDGTYIESVDHKIPARYLDVDTSSSSITDGTNTITAAGMWVTRTNATEGVAETNTLASTAAVTNIAELLIADSVNLSACWSKYGAWDLDYKLDESHSTVTKQTYTTNAYYQIMLNSTTYVNYSLAADLYLKMLDIYSLSTPVITNYVCQTPGGTIDSSGHLTAISNAIYECYAQATDGDTQKVKIPLMSNIYGTAEKNYYNADVDGTGRKTVNDEALTLVNAATAAGTGTYEGVTYYKWNYFSQPAWAATSAGSMGCYNQFAVGTKLMLGAAHYSWLTTGQQTVGSTTVTKGSWESLYTWAINNGWSPSDLEGTDITDVKICVLTSGEIPLADLPYLMSADQYDALFPSTADDNSCGGQGVICWAATQAFSQPAIAFINPNDHYGDFFCVAQALPDSEYYWTFRRYDIATALNSKGTGYPIHAGDSGHPIYFRKNGKYVLLSHFHFVGYGPCYVKLLPVLKKYAETHGSQLRLWDE